MANCKGAKKRILVNERNRQRNISVKSKVKTYTKSAMDAIDAKDAEGIAKAVPEALSAIDKAASKGVIHRNSAARRKSTLQRLAAESTK